MQYILNNPLILFLLILVGFLAYLFTKYLEKKIQPGLSGQRFVLYVLIVLITGFMLTVLFSFSIGWWLKNQNHR
ncbi:MAG: hypothetical protein ACM3H8_14590 [Sphingobacteriales bacterium]